MEHYVYSYIREDGSPYYIGKGKGKRAWDKTMHKNVHTPENDRIHILHSELSEDQAFEFEKNYIQLYGRKDIGTGILRNRTNGGEGTSGLFYLKTDEHKKKISKTLKLKGIRPPTRKGTIRSKEAIAKTANALRGRVMSEENRMKLKKPKEKASCPYCSKIGGINQMKRWHFDNCKEVA